jgi:hypothetical protein
VESLPKKPKLEKDIVDELREFMHKEGWLTEKTHGSMYAVGWPDLYAMHPVHRTRWIEVKREKQGALEESQKKKFLEWAKHGVGVYILCGIKDYSKLFGAPNWHLWTDNRTRRIITNRGTR